MSEYKYLDKDGLIYYHSKIKTLLGGKVDKVDGKGLSTNDFTTALKNKLDGVATGAEVNQNAFSNIVVGSTTIAADSKTDSLTITAGNNITLTPNATSDTLTIAATDTTYNDATQSVHGLMSVNDKKKLDGIATGAEVNQNAFSNVKVGNTTVAADAKTDTLELAAGSNVTLTPDATNDKVTIAATDTIPSGYCTTAAGTAAKTASFTNYNLLAKSYLQVVIQNANTFAGALTLNVNGKGAKPIYINGAASSASNYTLPAGTYFVFYNGTEYYFRTDGIIPGVIEKASKVTISTNPGSSTSSGPFGILFENMDGAILEDYNRGLRYYMYNDESVISIGGSDDETGDIIPGNIEVINRMGTINRLTSDPNVESSNNIINTLPGTSGTLLNTGTTSFTNSQTTGNTIGTLKLNGTDYVLKTGNIPQGTVTKVETSGAITGGPITSSGTISHSTAAGYKHIPANGASGNYLKYGGSSGTASWAAPDSSVSSSSTNTTIPGSKAVYDAIQDAISGITGIEFEIVQTLPSTGRAGTIYLVPNSGSAPNIYDEYIWITTTSKFEKIGTTDVDLSGYVQDTDMVSITNAEIDAIVA